ncbi:MAG: hypothetical protein JWO35_827 [Candidatus Saccharibacteria bacterium]|nr:hypothetical protein [Candidatus Saccharibacteria bacterium]
MPESQMPPTGEPLNQQTQEQARIAELEAQNAAQAVQLEQQQEALNTLIAEQANLHEAVANAQAAATRADEALKSYQDLLAANAPLPQQPAQSNGKVEEKPVYLPPQAPTPARPGTPAPQRTRIQAPKTPPAPAREEKRSLGSDRLKAGLAVAALAISGVSGYFLGKDNKEKVSTATTVTHTETAPAAKPSSTNKAPKAPSLSTHQKNLAQAEAATSVPEAVKTLHSTPSNIKANIHAIFNENSANTLDHTRGAMSSMLKSFKVGELGRLNGAETLAYSVKGSPAIAARAYNILHGDNNSNVLPEGVTNTEALASIEQMMTAEGAKPAVEQPTGTFMNHAQYGENIRNANIVTLRGDKDVFTFTTAAGKKIYFKTFNNNCFNILTPVTIETKPPTPVTPPAITRPPASVPHLPIKKKIPTIVTGPVKGHKPGRVPIKPIKPVVHPQPKVNKNLPPGHNGGTPDVAGKGPAGQKPDAAGFVPGELHPNTPSVKPPTPESTPLPNAPAPTVPAESGSDTGANQLPVPANVPGAGAPITGAPTPPEN